VVAQVPGADAAAACVVESRGDAALGAQGEGEFGAVRPGGTGGLTQDGDRGDERRAVDGTPEQPAVGVDDEVAPGIGEAAVERPGVFAAAAAQGGTQVVRAGVGDDAQRYVQGEQGRLALR